MIDRIRKSKDRQHYDQKKKDRQHYDQKKDRQHYDQKKKDRQHYDQKKRTNNDLQYIHMKLRIELSEPH